MYKSSNWNLQDLIKNNQELENMMQKIKQDVEKFKTMHCVLNQKITSNNFLKILDMLEKIYKNINIISSFASLSYSTNTQSEEKTLLLTQIKKFNIDIYNELLYFDLWWTKINKKIANKLIKKANHVSEYLEYKRKLHKHTLNEKEEKIINILNMTGISALTEIYVKITNSFKYRLTINRKYVELTRDEISNYFRDENATLRKKSYNSVLNKFEQNQIVLSDIYRNIVLNWNNEGIKIRKFKSPISIRNIENNIGDNVIEQLLEVCKKNINIFQKFFTIKAKLLKMKKLNRYDLYAPICPQKEKYSYDKSLKLILKTIQKFDLRLFESANKIINSAHIDSIIRFGKKDGAFCSSIAPGITPYVLVNFTDKLKDIFTVSHELGHAMHGEICKQPMLVYEPVLPLAETASTFTELLVYDELINQKNENEQKKAMMITERINDLYATIMRQAFFTKFEIDVHKKIANGATTHDISKIYLQNLTTQFGDSINVPNVFSVEWCSIPHFFHAPFYCYSYSFGNLLSLSLFQTFKEEQSSDMFVNILMEGGSKKPEILLKKYGIDINQYEFWERGFKYIEEQLQQLEKIY